MEMGGQTLSVPQAAEVLGLGVHAVHRAARERRLPVLRLGRKMRAPVAVLEEVLRDPEGSTPATGREQEG